MKDPSPYNNCITQQFIIDGHLLDEVTIETHFLESK